MAIEVVVVVVVVVVVAAIVTVAAAVAAAAVVVVVGGGGGVFRILTVLSAATVLGVSETVVSDKWVDRHPSHTTRSSVAVPRLVRDITYCYVKRI